MLAITLYYLGIIASIRWLRRHLISADEVVVLALHRVLTSDEAALSLSEKSMVVLLPTFLELLKCLSNECRVVTLEECSRWMIPMGRKPNILLTFDDAWSDTSSNVSTALGHYGTPACLFVPSGLVGKRERFWVERVTAIWRDHAESRKELSDRLKEVLKCAKGRVLTLSESIAALKQCPIARRDTILKSLSEQFSEETGQGSIDTFISAEQLVKISKQMTIGSHTVNHALLGVESRDTCSGELKISKYSLEAMTGQSVTAIAYPSGSYNISVAEQAQASGYQWGFTTDKGKMRREQSRFMIPRLLLHEANLINPQGQFSSAMFYFRITF